MSRPDLSNAHRRAIAYGIARHIGMPVVLDRDSRRDATWDGSRLSVPTGSESDLIHECAHYIVAARHGETQLPNWGVERDDYLTRLSDELIAEREGEAGAVERGLRAAIEAGAFEAALAGGYLP